MTIFFLASLTPTNGQTPKQVKSILADKDLYETDTIIENILIDGRKFTIKVLRDKFNEHLDKFTEEDDPSFTQSPITVVFTKNTDDNPIYVKRFDFEPSDYPYLDYSFYKGQEQNLKSPGKLYFIVNKTYGGSLSTHSIYFINFKDNKINLNHLFYCNELTHILYALNDKEVLSLVGIWNIEEGESHFGDHRFKITRYIFGDNDINTEEIGETKFKYSVLNKKKSSSEILTEIKLKEPQLLANINLTYYGIPLTKENLNESINNQSDSSEHNIFYLGDNLIPDAKKFKLIGISSQTNVHSYRYIGEYKNMYYYGRQISDIIVGIKNGKIVTTIYNVIPEKSDIGVPNEIIELIQKTLPFPLAYKNGIWGVNIDNESISISRTKNAMTFNNDRIMFLTTIKQSILRK